jgi:cytochrome c-type biogenesis protein CcmF
MANLFLPVSREASLVLNNVFLVSITGGVFLGTFISLIARETFGTDVSAGAPVFNFFFVPMMLGLMVFMALGPILAWKRGNLRAALFRLRAAAVAAAGAGASAIIMQQEPWSTLAIVISVWLLVGAMTTVIEKAMPTGRDSGSLWSRLASLPRATWGTTVAHAGIAITAISIAVLSYNTSETVAKLTPGQSLQIAGYELRLVSVNDEQGPNYTSKAARFELRQDGRLIDRMLSEKRSYPNPGSETTEAGIRPGLIGTLYVSLGRAYDDGAWAVRAYYHPLVVWIWGGCLIMVVGGILSLSDRRLRVGAPIRARRAQPAARPA